MVDKVKLERMVTAALASIREAERSLRFILAQLQQERGKETVPEDLQKLREAMKKMEEGLQ